MFGRQGIAAMAVLAVSEFVQAGNVTVDATLPTGFQNTRLPGPDYQLSESFGKVSGQNLLISLRHFDLDANETARFASQLPLKNVITRITGGTASTINGTVISDIRGANLFIVNPSGLVIGQTARFQVSGALHLSTADVIDFADRSQLSAGPTADPLLSSAAPAAFGFLGKPKPISVTGASFAGGVDVSASDLPNVLSLTGGEISLRSTSIDMPAGMIAIHSGASVGSVSVPTLADPGQANFTIGGVVVIEPARLSAEPLMTQPTLDARNSGFIRITAGDITLRGARLNAIAGESDGRAIELRASRTLLLTGDSRLDGSTEGDGNTAAIDLAGRDLVIEERSALLSEIKSTDEFAAAGSGTPVTLSGESITLRRRGVVLTSTTTGSRGSDIVVTATRSLVVDGVDANEVITGLETQTTSAAPGAGRGGDIWISSPETRVVREGEIFARTIGVGQAGDVRVTGDHLTIDAADLGFTGLQSRAGTGSTGGDGGVIEVNLTGDLVIRKGGAISATTFASGAGGNVVIRARNVFATEVGLGNIDEFTGEPFNGIFSRSAKTDEAGNPADGGPAGSVSVFATDQIRVAGGSTMGAQSASTENGAGNVLLSAPRITIDNGNVSVKSTFTDGGKLTLTGDTVVISNGSLVTAEAAADGDRLFIQPAEVVVLGSGSIINAIANGTPVETVIDPAATFIKSPDSTILADNPVLPPDVDVTAGLISFNISFVDIARQLQEDCNRRAIGNFSTFTVESRGGAWPTPVSLSP